jgi:hypothetical protein
MTSLTFPVRAIRAVPAGPPGEFPILDSVETVVPHDRERRKYFTEGGRAAGGRVLPYHPLGSYSRESVDTTTVTAILENDHLRATFLPELGGRLWSLWDKSEGRELLHQANPLQAANLALRNAWFAGGVEWNLGTRGHWPLTFEPVHTSWVESAQDGPILRMWEYERMLGITWRIDAWLPSASKVLFVKPLLRNLAVDDVGVYWWSNIAVPQLDRSRVVVPATKALHFGYEGCPAEVEVPVSEGSDISYPTMAADAADYFFHISDAIRRPWIAAVDQHGYGLSQVSTRQLLGRKLFVWGTSPGGEHWQDWLSGSRRYFEIQAGLTRTQYEQLLLPSGQSLSWTEAYGAIDIDPGVADGPAWDHVVRATEEAIDRLVDVVALDAAHASARDWEDASPEGPPVVTGSGWGALEVAVGHLVADPATPYAEATMGELQSPWMSLASSGVLPEQRPPASTMVGRRWRERLETCCVNWHDWLHLGLLHLGEGSTVLATDALHRSLALAPNPWAYRNLADIERESGLTELASSHLLQALDLLPSSEQLTIETLRVLTEAGNSPGVLAVVDSLPPPIRTAPRVLLYECGAALALGGLERAEGLLRGGITVPDLQEGEVSFEALWAAYQRATGRNEEILPQYDFSMRRVRDTPPGPEGVDSDVQR